MDSLASLAFSLRSSYPRSDLSELSLRKSSSSRLRLGSLTSSDISVGFRGHPLHYCYSTESPPLSSDVCDRVLELSPERDKLRMSPWLFRFKSTAGEAVDQGWRIQPPSLLPNLSVVPPWSEGSNLKVIICPPIVLRPRTYGGPQDSRGCPSAFNDGSALGVVPRDSRQRQLQFSTGSGTHRTNNINLGIGVFVPRSIYVNIIYSRCPLRVAPSRTGVYFVVQRKRDRCSGMYGGKPVSARSSSFIICAQEYRSIFKENTGLFYCSPWGGVTENFLSLEGGRGKRNVFSFLPLALWGVLARS